MKNEVITIGPGDTMAMLNDTMSITPPERAPGR